MVARSAGQCCRARARASEQTRSRRRGERRKKDEPESRLVFPPSWCESAGAVLNGSWSESVQTYRAVSYSLMRLLITASPVTAVFFITGGGGGHHTHPHAHTPLQLKDREGVLAFLNAL